jgi:hypothetical protein
MIAKADSAILFNGTHGDKPVGLFFGLHYPVWSKNRKRATDVLISIRSHGWANDNLDEIVPSSAVPLRTAFAVHRQRGYAIDQGA